MHFCIWRNRYFTPRSFINILSSLISWETTACVAHTRKSLCCAEFNPRAFGVICHDSFLQYFVHEETINAVNDLVIISH